MVQEEGSLNSEIKSLKEQVKKLEMENRKSKAMFDRKDKELT